VCLPRKHEALSSPEFKFQYCQKEEEKRKERKRERTILQNF
jgi:hypothetical protein